MSGLKLVAALILVGGVIAYIGDKIGMKVGRKRLTLFGMRPKHTSIMITILTGILIAASTLAIMAVVSQDARDALFRLNAIKTALATSQGQLTDLKTRVQAQNEELKQINDEMERAVKIRDEAVAKRDEALAQRDALQKEVADLKAELQSSEKQLEQLKTRIQTLTDIGKQLNDTKIRLESEVNALSRSLDQMVTFLQMGNLNEAVVYRREEIVLATVMQGDQPWEQTKEQMLQFLERADQLAVERGARIQNKDNERALAFRPGNFSEAVDFLASSKGKWIVRVVATQNTFKGNPVPVEFVLYEDKLAFNKGDIVASRLFKPGDAPEDQIAALLSDVNQKALEVGMITDEKGIKVDLTMDGLEFVETVTKLRNTEDPVQIVAVVLADTRLSEGPLKIGLEIRKAPSAK